MTTADGSRLRVLLVHERYRQYGGEDAVFDAQAALLERMGHPVDTVVVDNDEIAEQAVRGRLELAVTTVWSRRGVRDVAAATRRFRPDVVSVHNTFPLLSPAIYGPVRELGPAILQTLHNYRLVCPSGNLFRDGRPCEDCVGLPVALPGVVHACYRDSNLASGVVAAMLAVHRARLTWQRDVDLFIALAAFARDRLAAGGVPLSRTVVIPNFVAGGEPPESYEGDGLLFVGRLTEDKGVTTLLDAWLQLAPGAGGVLRIAGDGPLREAVEAATRTIPGIEFLGRLEPADVGREMERARAIVVPSRWYENCPMTVLEAFARGRPVIASGHGALVELVAHDVTGLHVRPGDPADLAAAMRFALQDASAMASLGRAARSQYERRYSPDVAYALLHQAFRLAIRHRHSRTA